MPSGSRGGSSGRSGGGGGSHFSSGGSRSYSGGSRGHYGGSIGPRMFRGRPGTFRGRSVFFIGTRYYIPATAMNKLSSMLMGLFVILFFSIIPFILIFSHAGTLKIIEADYVYYQDMIADAEVNPDLRETGTITAIKRHETVDKWYLEYYFIADNGAKVDGYTYSIYTWEQAKDFVRGGSIQLAVDSLQTTGASDSVNMDYKNFKLEDDGEYIYARTLKTIMIIIYLLFVAGFVALLISIIVTYKKQLQEKEEEAEQKKAEELEEKKANHCAYCGSVINGNKETCSKCGAANLNYKKQ